MSKIMIVVGHPQRTTFCEALGRAYARGAASGGHEAKLFNLSEMNFDAILHEGYRREQPLEPDLRAAYETLKSSDHVVLIFPLWCGDMPALLKGFIERILQPDLMRRRGTDQEIANVVTFLASDLASYVHGAFVPVCGGNVMPAI